MAISLSYQELEQRNKKLENELEETKEKLQLLANNFKDVICLHNVDGKYIYVSPSCKHILGYDPKELIGTEPWRFVHPDDLADLVKKSKEKMKGKEGLSTYRIRKKNGEYIWVESVNQRILDKNGKVTKFVTSSRDITERKLAEKKLKESEMNYKLIIENTSDAIAITQKGQFIFVNNALSQMLGYSKEDLLEIDKQKILSREALKSIENNKKEIFTNKFNTILYKKDGSNIDVEISEKCIHFNDKKSQLVVIRNITEQKTIIKELQKGAEQTKGLNEFIPICAGCSKIRDDDKEEKSWVKPADYISERLPDIKFSHTMCPDCTKKWYPDIEFKKKRNKI